MVMSVKPEFGKAACPAQWLLNHGMTVAVVIPTYNHARYLADAISSVIAQTRRPDEIIVVDDGSTDDPAAIVARFPGVQLIRQEHQGVSAARNTGLRSCTASHIVFLDADDRLLSNALEAGLNCVANYSDCAFVYGAHRYITHDGADRGNVHYRPISGDPNLALMRHNLIGMQATAVFRRDCLLAVGGYDRTLELCEDYDLYLRLVRKHRVACHPGVVAEYRWHGQNTSGDAMKMLRAILKVLDRHEARIGPNTLERDALQQGRADYRDHYGWALLEASYANGPSLRAVKSFGQAIEASPWMVARTMTRFVYRRFQRALHLR
jgi:glycosyltransferase involved in cell wall biosynthesis